MNFKIKYNKYKNKYLNLKMILEGGKGGTYIEFITEKSETIKVNLDNEEEIHKILNKYLSNISKLICLDFHGVTDLYDNDETIPSELDKCVISYISGNPKTIKNTIETVRPRILGREILLGIIVYNKDQYPVCGTKGWIISKILEINNNMNIYFIDDSKKNIVCVDNVKSSKIKTFFVNKYKNPKQHLHKLLLRL
jgi:hypothetical protein